MLDIAILDGVGMDVSEDGCGEDFLDVMASVYPAAGISTEQQLTVAFGLQTPVFEPVSRLQSG